jgi:dTDP-glucose pyrophosphorylase
MSWKRLAILPNASVKDALKQLDLTAEKTLLVVDDTGVFLGTISDGDIRRHLIRGNGLDESINVVYNAQGHSVKIGHFEIDAVRNMMLDLKIMVVPVLDDHEKIVHVVLFDEVIDRKDSTNRFSAGRIDIPVVIMAGGKGTRLAPFTQVLPKPLIPIGEKTILEIIIEGFERFNASQFFFTVNYRGAMIKAYFDSIEKKSDITYLWEKEFCGTAGSLELLPADIANTFIVSNCDIIVKADYAEVLKFHRDSQADLTVIASIQHHVIPYGVVEYGEHGVVSGIKEKPEFSFSINTGVYVVNKSCLQLIPHGEVFHMTHMMEAVIAKGGKVVTYLVNEKDYIDIGQWEEYNKALERMKGIV